VSVNRTDSDWIPNAALTFVAHTLVMEVERMTTLRGEALMNASVDEIPKTRITGEIEWAAIRIDGSSATRILARGRGASSGRVRGRARLVSKNDPLRGSVPGAILVCEAVTPELLPQLAYASAVVTERGGVLSRGATHCRELGIPCIVAAEGATRAIRDGRVIELDADAGEVSAPIAS
jgi:phosphohistidine swiveling domain-containing protein